MKRHLVIWGSLIVAIILFGMINNNTISVERFSYHTSLIDERLDGFKILQISDLHNRRFGKDQARLLRRISRIEPDLILITGDLIDSKSRDFEPVIELLEGISSIKTIFVPGNHEAINPNYNELLKILAQYGVEILSNSTSVYRGIRIVGLRDPLFEGNIKSADVRANITEVLSGARRDGFGILLAHRPEFYEQYKVSGFNLAFAGHAHGGGIRLPFIGGLIAPGQGLFPKYTKGAYYDDNFAMFVSAGLGNSILPVRLFNPPHLIVVELRR